MHKSFSKPFVILIASLCGVSAAFMLCYPVRAAQLHTHWITAGDLDMGYPLLGLSVIALYFRTKTLKPTIQPLGLLLLLCVSALMVVANLIDLKSVFFILLALSLYCVAIACVGVKQFLDAVALPLTVVIMAFPFWYLAISPLQFLTTSVNAWIVQLLGFTAIIEGNYILLPTGTIHIAHGCSGLKYFLSAATLAVINAIIAKHSLRMFFVGLASILLLAVLANWVRVFILICIGYFVDMSHPLVAEHDNLGWIVFAIFMAPWFILIRKAGGAEKKENLEYRSATMRSRHIPLYAILTALVSFIPFLTLQILGVNAKPNMLSLALPNQLANATQIQRSIDWSPAYSGYAQSLSANYLLNARLLQITILDYGDGAEKELTSQEQQLFDREHYIQIGQKTYQTDGASFTFNISQGEKNGRKRIVYSWFQHGQFATANVLESKIAEIRSLFDTSRSAALVSVSFRQTKHSQQPATPDDDLLRFLLELQLHVGALEKH